MTESYFIRPSASMFIYYDTSIQLRTHIDIADALMISSFVVCLSTITKCYLLQLAIDRLLNCFGKAKLNTGAEQGITYVFIIWQAFFM